MSGIFSTDDASAPWERSADGEGVVWEDVKFPGMHLYELIPGVPLRPVPDVRVSPFSGVCSVDTRVRHLGSGTLITPNLVLTGAHVLSKGVAATAGTTEMSTLQVTTGGTSEVIAVARAEYYHSDWVHEGQPYDFALLRLARSSASPPLRLARQLGPPPTSTVVEVSGYPEQRQQAHSRGRVIGSDAEWLDYSLSTMPYQSGSPILYGQIVVGVHLLGPGYGNTPTVANRGLWLRPEIVTWIDGKA